MTAHIPDDVYAAYLAACEAVERAPTATEGPFNRTPLERCEALLEKQRAMVRMVHAMVVQP